jgi:hypothetical protein
VYFLFISRKTRETELEHHVGTCRSDSNEIILIINSDIINHFAALLCWYKQSGVGKSYWAPRTTHEMGRRGPGGRRVETGEAFGYPAKAPPHCEVQAKTSDKAKAQW